MKFVERYGRIDTIYTDRDSGGGFSNTQSRGSSRTTTKVCRPGIMPTLFGRHLIGNAVFLSLEEVAAGLPALREEVIAVPMEPDLAEAYEQVETKLKDAIREMIRKGDKRLLGAMLATLLGYPDQPWGWETVGYKERTPGGGSVFVGVVTPPSLDHRVYRAKERELVGLVKREWALGRQVWVYCTLNGKHDVASRLEDILLQEGYHVLQLKAEVPPKEREQWIDTHCQDVDVVISHPRLVETGLDLFSKKHGGHNFCTLVFYQTGYNPFTLRQASRRSWRIGQAKECKVYYLYYAGTMQERAMSLMGKKLAAAQALEGKFSAEGLVAMAGSDNMEIALARSLAENMEENAARAWARLESTPDEPVAALPLWAGALGGFDAATLARAFGSA